jgi:hypothetical protein
MQFAHLEVVEKEQNLLTNVDYVKKYFVKNIYSNQIIPAEAEMQLVQY